MGEDDAAGEPLLELDRDRGARAAAAVEQPLAFLVDQAAEVVDDEVAMRVCRAEDTPGRAGDRADSRSCLGQLLTRLDEVVDERVGGLRRLAADLEEGLDGPSCHPARSVLAVVAKLLDRCGQGRHAGNLAGDS